jgi:uncharacterized membrane protein YfcA
MKELYDIFFALVGFLASIVGAICGIGGGLFIKPILDAFGILPLATINFLSGCTVLSMTCYSVFQERLHKEYSIKFQREIPLVIGAVVGGVLGSYSFQFMLSRIENHENVSNLQAICLMLITAGALFYTLNKEKINTYDVTNQFVCFLIGLLLGMISSFLGIGGGPINLVVLYYFFSMETKEAAQNSLYIILFSQTANLINTIVKDKVPDFGWGLLGLMIVGGILGGVVGKKINRKIDSKLVNKLFVLSMCCIMLICIFNLIQ